VWKKYFLIENDKTCIMHINGQYIVTSDYSGKYGAFFGFLRQIIKILMIHFLSILFRIINNRDNINEQQRYSNISSDVIKGNTYTKRS